MRYTKSIFVLMALAIMMSGSVLALTEEIYPESQGSYASWTNTGCSSSSEYQCVDEETVNTTDYLSTTSKNAKESFVFENPAIPAEATINSVTLNYYAKYGSSSRYKTYPMIRSSGIDYDGSLMTLTSSYSMYSRVYATNPATGSAWTLAELNALEAGMHSANTNNGGGNVAQVYAVVDYSLPDLIISNLTLSASSAMEGQTVAVTVVTKNNAPVASGASTTRVSNGANHDFGVSSLGAGSMQFNSFNYTCGTSNVTFTATADVNSNVSESDEGNNQAFASLTCIETVKPDLVIDSIAFNEYSVLVNGTEVVRANVTAVVKNVGLGNAASSTTRILPLGWNYFTSAVLSGQSYTILSDYVCSSAHNYTAVADYNSVVLESDEGNNQGQTYIDCVI